MPNQEVCRDCGCDLTEYDMNPASCPGCGGLNPTKSPGESEAEFYASEGYRGLVLKNDRGDWVHCENPVRVEP